MIQYVIREEANAAEQGPSLVMPAEELVGGRRWSWGADGGGIKPEELQPMIALASGDGGAGDRGRRRQDRCEEMVIPAEAWSSDWA